LTLKGIPYGGTTPYFVIKQNRGLPYDEIYNSYQSLNHTYRYYYENENQIEFELNEELKLCGNIMIIFYHVSWYGKSWKVFRYTINTSYIPSDTNTITTNRWGLSPEDAHKDYKRLPENLELELKFTNACQKCTYNT